MGYKKERSPSIRRLRCTCRTSGDGGVVLVELAAGNNNQAPAAQDIEEVATAERID